MKVTSVLMLLFSGFIISCHHDDPSSTKPNVAAAAEIAVTAPSDLLFSGTSYTVISDKNGKILAYSKNEKDKTVTLRIEQPYSDPTFSITDFFIFDSSQQAVTISTRTELPVTTTSWIPFLVSQPSQENNASINATSSSSSCEFVTNLAKGYSTGGPFNLAVSNPSKLLVIVPTSGGSKSHLFDNNGIGYTSKNTEAYPIDLSQVTSDVLTEQVAIPTTNIQKYAVIVDMAGVITSNIKDEYYRYGSAQISSDFKIQLLTPPGFDSYVFGTRFTNLNGTTTYVNSSPTGVDFTMLDATAKINAKAKNSVDFTTSGNIDAVTATFSQGNFTWSVSGPPVSGVRSIKLPEIPSEIKSILSKIDFSNFDYYGMFLQKYKNLNGYLDVINMSQKRRVVSSSNSVITF